jgi:ankyrin repeat protein
MIAVAKGHTEIVKELLKNTSLNINVSDPGSGIYPFWLACFYGHGHIMKLLAEKTDTDILVKNNEDINVLHLAIYKNDLRIVKMLLKSGFPIDHITKAGYTCLHLAAIMNRVEIVEEILNYLKEG